MPARTKLLAAISILTFTLVASAQTQPAPRVSRSVREYQKLQEQIQAEFAAKNYEKAAASCDELLKKFPDDPVTQYNLACAYARMKKPAEALDNLAKAVDSGWA